MRSTTTIAIAVVLAAGALPASATTVPLPQHAATHFVSVERGARAGTTVASAGDFDGDGLEDVVTGGRNVAYVILGGADGEVRSDDERVVKLELTPERRQDVSVAGIRDVDADGYDDIALGAPKTDERAGAVFVVYGRPDPAPLLVDDPTVERVVRLDGEQAGDHAGQSVAAAGDANGDGTPDLVVGAPLAGARDRGAAYVVSGAALSNDATLPMVASRIHDPEFGKDVGYSVSAAGDVNGDGLEDVVVGAPSRLVTARPAAYVVFGRAHVSDVSLRALGTGGWIVRGGRGEIHENAGEAVAGGHDVNGDGTPDVVLGAPSARGPFGYSGVAFVVFGSGSTETVELGDLGERGFRIEAGVNGFEAGRAVALVADHDGNGLADVLVGDPFERRGYRHGTLGAAYHLVGQAGTDTIDLGRLGRDGVRYVAEDDALAGASVAATGNSLVVGARGEGAGARNGGAVYLFGAAEPAPYDRPPRVRVVSYAARQIARFGNYCWDGLCVDRRPSFPRADEAGAGDQAHFRILYAARPDGVALTAFRELDEFGRPAGNGRSVDGDLEPVREFSGAPISAWELRFRLPERPGHLYLTGSAVWEGLDRGDVSWFAHLRLRRHEGHTDLSSPPDTTLRTDGVRDRGALSSYCWSRSFSDGTGVTMCVHAAVRLEPLPPERARAGARAFIRIHTRHRPDRVVLRLHREHSSGYPAGRPRRVDYRIRRQVVNGKTTAWDVRFRLPDRRGHLYPLMRATWDQHGTAPYDWHLVLT